MRSRIAKSIIVDMDQLYPSILKSPIIHDEKRLMVGYNEHHIS